MFLSLLALDIAINWLQMYSTFLVGESSHKDVKDSNSWLFWLYYGNQKFWFLCDYCFRITSIGWKELNHLVFRHGHELRTFKDCLGSFSELDTKYAFRIEVYTAES